MKTILAIVMFSVVTFAQSYTVGLNLNYNMATGLSQESGKSLVFVNGSPQPILKDNISNGVSFGMNFTHTHQIDENFSFYPQANINFNSYDFDLTYSVSGNSEIMYNYEFSFLEFSAPLTLKYQISQGSHIFFGGGPLLGFDLGKSKVTVNRETKDNVLNSDGFYPFIVVGSGITKNTFNFEILYDYVFKNVKEKYTEIFNFSTHKLTARISLNI